MLSRLLHAPRPRRATLIALTCGLVLGTSVTAGISVAADKASSVKVCVTKKNVVRSANADGSCPSGTSQTKIGVTGPAGPAGAAGQAGSPGAPGSAGPGATAFSFDVPATDTLQALPLGTAIFCHAPGPADRIELQVGEVNGTLTFDPSSTNMTSALSPAASASATSFMVAEIFGEDPQGTPVKSVTFVVRLVGSTCEVHGVTMTTSP